MIYTDAQSLLRTIRATMAFKGISIKELSERMEYPQQTVSSFFRKDKEDVKLGSIKEICNALGFELEINLIPIDKGDTE